MVNMMRVISWMLRHQTLLFGFGSTVRRSANISTESNNAEQILKCRAGHKGILELLDCAFDEFCVHCSTEAN